MGASGADPRRGVSPTHGKPRKEQSRTQGGGGPKVPKRSQALPAASEMLVTASAEDRASGALAIASAGPCALCPHAVDNAVHY